MESFYNVKDFYPTPNELIRKMLSDVNWSYVQNVLEPSCGKGNIIDYIKEIYGKKAKYSSHKTIYECLDIDCIEIDENLRHILKGKDYKVVHDDFMTYNTYKRYDLIIANFPFSDGDKHLLKAIEMQEKSGNALICLVNSETLKNPYSNYRKVLLQKLEDADATIEYIPNAFVDAERKTGVEVALIKVKFAEQKQDSYIYSNLKKAQELREQQECDNTYEVADNDIIKASVQSYKLEMETGLAFIREYKSIKKYMQKEFSNDGKEKESILKLTSYYSRNSDEVTENEFVKNVRKKYWNALFQNPKFTGKLTENLRSEYMRQVESLSNYDFSEFNIKEIKIDMMKKVSQGIEECILQLFEDMTHKYSYYDETSKNVHMFNGWKSNLCYMLNKKVVLPNMNAYDDYYTDRFIPTGYSRYNVMSKLEDMEKCFNYLDCGRTSECNLKDILKQAEDTKTTKDIQLKYFKVTFYKKGTCHITFTNLEIWKKFNIFAGMSAKYNALPPTYGKKRYKDMTAEEKAVVDEFDGNECEYEKIASDSKYYIVDTNSFLLAVS